MREARGKPRRAGRIVEVEAYDGPEDRASHARFGRTARNGSMFAIAGTAYVYLVYGMHDLLNVAAGATGEPSAILVRAVEPLEGLEEMRRSLGERAAARRRSAVTPPAGRRRLADARLASGPGLVTAAFGVDRSDDGVDLLEAGRLRLEPGVLLPDERVASGPRIGIGYAAEPWQGVPWRFWIEGHPSVSQNRGPRSGG